MSEEPTRALLRAAIVAVREGRLDAAARVMADLARRRAALRWPALLLALESAELRLGGAVAIATPPSRFVASPGLQIFEERWGAFEVFDYARERMTIVEIVPRAGGLELAASGMSIGFDGWNPIGTIRTEVEAFLGVAVTFVIRPIGA